MLTNDNIFLMKTHQLILAATLVALAGCNKDNVDTRVGESSTEVGFNVVSSMNTKANDALLTGTTYGTDNTFQVWGWSSANGSFTDEGLTDGLASNFMKNLTISWTKGRDGNRAEAWRNSANYYYWPFTGAVSFLAVHPSTVVPTTVSWDATNKKGQATLDNYTITDGNKTTDLMFAVNQGSRSTETLPLVFKHALAQIQFRIRTNDNYSADVTFTVNGITLNNIDLSGDLAYTNAAYTWSDNDEQDDQWNYSSTTQNAAYPAEGLDSNAANYGSAVVMIPQASYSETSVTVNYTMTQNGASAVSGDVTVKVPQAWAAGSRYVYTLNFNLNEILFNPSIDSDWATVTVNTVNFSL
jgi:hypothetical protein